MTIHPPPPRLLSFFCVSLPASFIRLAEANAWISLHRSVCLFPILEYDDRLLLQ